jgi:molybdopterin-containing oxidoreductase family iron-sulfur binding subunit
MWRHLAELGAEASAQDAAGNEFAAGASLPPDRPSRRHFLKLMAAGAGLAGMTGCRWPKENILPYAHRPPEIVPGNPIYFATSAEIGGQTQGLVITSYDGRPIKVDGNPLHPNNRGGTDARAQASILDLYDPDRSKSPVQQVDRQFLDQRWGLFDDWAREHFGKVRGTQGKGLHVLAEASQSPSVRDMRERFARAYPRAKWYEYEPISWDKRRAGSQVAFGRHYRTHYRFDQAAVVLSLDSDFLITHPAALAYGRDFIAAHTPGVINAVQMSRLYVAESTYTNTGAMADSRLVVAKSALQALAGALVGALVDAGLQSAALPASLVESSRDQAPSSDMSAFARAAAKDLLAHRGKGIIIVGEQQPAEMHALAHVLNAALGNVGQTVWYSEDPEGDRPGHVEAIRQLVEAMRAGQVETLLILGGNPVYNAPADLDFARAMAAVPVRVQLSLYWNETSRLCTWHLPRAHYLETWGDTRAYDGTYAPAQPLISPLYEGRSVIELLSQLCETPSLSGYEIVQRTARLLLGRSAGGGVAAPGEHAPATAQEHGTRNDRSTPANTAGVAPAEALAGKLPVAPSMAPEPGDFAAGWKKLLSDGVLAGTQLPAQLPQLQADALAKAIQQRQAAPALGPQNLEIAFHEDRKVYDGQLANNAWLQELPDVFTKITWGNAVLMGVQTAETLGVRNGEVIEIQRAGASIGGKASYGVSWTKEGGARILGPVYVMPGQAEWSLTVSLGYGRQAAGSVGNGVGFNAYNLRTSDAMDFAAGASVRATGNLYAFATTQEHWPIDRVGREAVQVRLKDLVPEMTLAEYGVRLAKAPHDESHEKPGQLWPPYEYDGYKWGMAIDMQKCIGCNACVIACQAENNVPVVGAEQVRRQREMQWLRIDRYFRGGPADPLVSFQPMFCVHCENAPCESVCPVAATLHDSDGLNLMVYNRCVGTRYCSNNCPYKVRRFNFYHYTKNPSQVRQMQYNPDVTVRSRGVMEKCTYCVQRIQRAKITAKNERRGILDGSFTTACAQACPTGAIVFGDLNDKDSLVARLQRHSRSYAVLEELNTRPRSLHMARVRNPGTNGTADEETGREADREQQPQRGHS